jgi:hypothetical protein
MRALAMVVTAATLLAAACGDRQGPTEASIAGTYELQTVDGKPLPVVDTQQQSALMSGALMLGGAGAFTVTNNYRMGPGGSAGDLTLSVSGTFRVSGQTITFSALDQGAGSVTFSGTVSGNTLTVTLNGSVMVYRR